MSSASIARTGRNRQRYEDNLRLVSGCIPYRLIRYSEDLGDNSESKLEVLMVSSPNRDDLVFPKGGWENDETVEEAACREALEEAGVKGILNKNLLGVWLFRSKSSEELCSLRGGCKGYMFALEVVEELETWPEQKIRDRRWLSVKEAFRLCRYEWMRGALERLVKVQSENGSLDMGPSSVKSSSRHMSSDAVEGCQVMLWNSFVKPSAIQNHDVMPLVHYSPEIAIKPRLLRTS